MFTMHARASAGVSTCELPFQLRFGSEVSSQFMFEIQHFPTQREGYLSQTPQEHRKEMLILEEKILLGPLSQNHLLEKKTLCANKS